MRTLKLQIALLTLMTFIVGAAFGVYLAATFIAPELGK